MGVIELFDEFDKQLALLCAGFNVPCTADRREAYGKGFRKLAPMAWDRLIEYCLGEQGPDRMPSVRDLWQIRKEMRAVGAMQAPTATATHDSRWQGDNWDIAGNFHLLAHITRRVGASSQCYGRGPSYMGMKTTTTPNADASAEFVQNVSDLVHAKKAWSADMRDIEAAGEVPVELQKKIWNDYIATAEKLITSRKLPDVQA